MKKTLVALLSLAALGLSAGSGPDEAEAAQAPTVAELEQQVGARVDERIRVHLAQLAAAAQARDIR